MIRDVRVLRLIAAALGSCVGAALVLIVGLGVWPVLVAGVVLGVGLLLGIDQSVRQLGMWFVAAGLVAAVSGAWQLGQVRDGPVPGLAAQRASVSVTGTVAGAPEAVTTSTGVSMTVLSLHASAVTDIGSASDVGGARLLLFAFGSSWQAVIPGERIAVTGRLEAADATDSVAAVMDADSRPREIAAAPWWQRLAQVVRLRTAAACSGLPTAERSLVPALVIGVVDPMPTALANQFRVTGLSHLIAVSGENLAIMFAAVVWLLQRTGLRRWQRGVVLIVTLVAFVLVARPSPSVVRAAVMGAIAVVAMLSGRRSAPLPLLSVAVAGMVIVDPWLIRSLGFGLSVSATAGLILLSRPISEQLARVMPRKLAMAIAIPTAAQLACTPLLVGAFHQLTPYAIPANLLAGLAVGPATLAGVVVAVFAVPVPPLAELAAWLAAVPAAWIIEAARVFAGLPDAAASAPTGVTVMVGLVIGLALVLVIRANGVRAARSLVS